MRSLFCGRPSKDEHLCWGKKRFPLAGNVIKGALGKICGKEKGL